MNAESQPVAEGRRCKPFWAAKSVWLACALIVLGAFLWIKDRGAAKTSTGAPLPGVSQFSDSGGATASGQPEAKPSSPAVFRFGASYLGGFFLGWMLRRFVKLTLLFCGAAICLVAVGRHFGWFDLDWNWVEAHLRQSLAWVQGEAGSFKIFITGYLPSAGAAAAGTFFGFRSR